MCERALNLLEDLSATAQLLTNPSAFEQGINQNLEITFHFRTSHAHVSALVLWKVCSELNSSQMLPPGLTDAPSADGDRPGCHMLKES